MSEKQCELSEVECLEKNAPTIRKWIAQERETAKRIIIKQNLLLLDPEHLKLCFNNLDKLAKKYKNSAPDLHDSYIRQKKEMKLLIDLFNIYNKSTKDEKVI